MQLQKNAKAMLILNLIVKAANIFLIMMPVLFPDLPQFQGKAVGARLVMYPAACFIVPLIWWLRGHKSLYPHLIDILIVLPFVIDSSGNALNLYHLTTWFDQIAHWFNWVLLALAFGTAVSSPKLSKANVFGLALGFGAVTHILWEICEYVVMKLGATRMQLTYVDTMEDLMLSGLGSVCGAILAITLFWCGKLLPKSE